MPEPTSAGIANWAVDTGRVKVFNSVSYVYETIYYDGVSLGSITPTKYFLANNSYDVDPSPKLLGSFEFFKGLEDSSRYVIVCKKSGDPDYYLRCAIIEEDLGLGDIGDYGYLSINKINGNAYLSSVDDLVLSGWSIYAVDTYLNVDGLATFQIFRSSLNSYGESQVPDFIERYSVKDSTMVSGINQTPFAFLPAKPLQGSSLSFEITQNEGSNGTFTGLLYDAYNPNLQGFGYSINYDSPSLTFTNRKTETITLDRPANQIKLPDPAIVDRGIIAKLNGTTISELSDYNIDFNAGLITFTTPVGESDPSNLYDISGSITDLSTFTSLSAVFNSSHYGSYVYIPNGSNAGFYEITTILSPYVIKIKSNFKQKGSQIINVKKTREVLADNFWSEVTPQMKKFKLYRGSSTSGPFTRLKDSEFKVSSQTGLVSLSTPAEPGDVFRADYEYTYTNDNGVTYDTTTASEFLSSNVRLVDGTYTPGNRYFTFDNQNKTVLADLGLKVIVDGVTLDPSNYTFAAPNKVSLGTSLTTEEILVTFPVAECVGGNNSFNTQHSPLVLDQPEFIQDTNTITLNGDLTSQISENSGLLVADSMMLFVLSVSYDSVSDTTTLGFSNNVTTPHIGTFKACDPIVFKPISNYYKTLVSGTNILTIAGSANIQAGSALLLASDPYYVTSSSYDDTLNITTVSLAKNASRNYIGLPISVSSSLIKTVGIDFTTSKSAIVSDPFALFKESDYSRELTVGIDYTISDGGNIKLFSTLKRGEKLYFTYVARNIKPAGTRLDINYAHAIAPNEDNGIGGQNLVASFNLYAPDSFYYRLSTVINFIPEVSSAISVSGPSTSGPTTGASPGVSLKSMGVSSLYFDEQHYANLDDVTKRLLFYYNNITNLYEDLLSNYDGRVVGGTSGRFKYDGLSGSKRESIPQVTNDIDDQIVAYEEWQGIDDFPYIAYVPVWKALYEYQSASRIFPTRIQRNFLVNSNVGSDNRDKIFSNIGVTKIDQLSDILSAISVSQFKTIDGVNLAITTNGDRRKFSPAFKEKMPVAITRDDGSFLKSTTVSSISGSGPYTLVIADPVEIKSGGVYLLNNVDAGDDEADYPENRLYKSYDYNLNSDTGNLINATYEFLVTFGLQDPFVAGEYLTLTADFTNTNTAPRRIPVLDGLIYNDDGFLSVPPLKRTSELDLLDLEIAYLSSTNQRGIASLFPDLITISVGSGLNLSVGDTVQFIDGPNAGLQRQIAEKVNNELFKVESAFSSSDGFPYPLVKSASYDAYLNDLNSLYGVLDTNVAASPAPGAYIGLVNSEAKTVNSIIEYMGEFTGSGSGYVSGSTLTVNGPLGTLSNSYIYISSGSNIGLYKVKSNISTIITVDTTAPYYGFSTPGTVSYQIIKRYGFMTDSGTQFLADALKKNSSFAEATYSWKNDPDPSLFPARLASVIARKEEVYALILNCQNVLKNGDSLYNRRYLWIAQRTDKKSGFITSKILATQQRIDNTKTLMDNQEKQLALAALMG
jgi:hypothetical protein